MVVNYCFLEKTNDKLLKFQVDNRFYFKISASLFLITPSDRHAIGFEIKLTPGVLIRGNTIFPNGVTYFCHWRKILFSLKNFKKFKKLVLSSSFYYR